MDGKHLLGFEGEPAASCAAGAGDRDAAAGKVYVCGFEPGKLSGA